MMKTKRVLVILLITGLVLLVACEKDSIVSPNQTNRTLDHSQRSSAGTLKIGVFSDAHYYDATLGVEGTAYEMYTAQDPKMLAESHALLQATIDRLMSEDVDIVLVPGDLTKDGELHNHQIVANFLAQLEDAGKKVYVIPGNHDISNPHASSFQGSILAPMPSITPTEFADIYNDFGYEEAIYRDPNSLSYIACPKNGFWVLGMDDCNYDYRFPELSLVDGKLSDATANWIVEKLQYAQAEGISVIGFIHHGVVEHFPGMEQVFPEYLIEDWESVASMFVANGLKIVFTGHHHATDIATYGMGRNKLFDVQTGALVTWQCPYRIVRYDKLPGVINIDNKIITSITPGPPMDFQTYAFSFLASRLPMLVIYQLMQMGLDQPTATALEPLVSATLLAYYHGDESTMRNEDVIAGLYQLLQNPNPAAQNLGQLLLGIWTDRTPDSDVFININNGQIFGQGIL